MLQSVSSLNRSRVSLTHPVCNLSSRSSGGEYLLPSPCLYGCSTGHVRETPHSPNVETVSSRGVKRNLPAERTHRFHHGACKRNSPPTLDETHTSTGLVRDTPLSTKDKIDSKTECVRETPGPLNDETDCSTGRVRETLHPMYDPIDSRTERVRESPHLPNDETDSSKGRVREIPIPTNRLQHGACKRNSPPNERRDRLQH